MNPKHHDTFSADKSRTLINTIMAKISKVGKWRTKFIAQTLMLFLLVRGRCNFANVARYGFCHEHTARRNFERSFDWFRFNAELIMEHSSENRINVFDPSFIPKSRKKTPHVGMFWSGTSGKALSGLEIGGIAMVDLNRNTALHLEAVQTPSAKELKEQGKTLVDHYVKILVDRKDILEKISKYLVVDGYFGKSKFFDGILENTKLEIITKLRNDADLQYLYRGKQKKGSGRPKKFSGKVDWKNLPPEQWETTVIDEDTRLLSAILWSPTLKRELRIVVVQEMKNGALIRYAVLASSDITLSPKMIFEYYTSRFQIEFLFRDAKQFAGLTDCQARNENKLDFHFNASLTAVSVAKVAHFFETPTESVPTYSLADIGMAYFNEFFADFFFSKLDIEPKSEKITAVLPSLLSFGLIHSG